MFIFLAYFDGNTQHTTVAAAVPIELTKITATIVPNMMTTATNTVYHIAIMFI